jgi:hypothetical protein
MNKNSKKYTHAFERGDIVVNTFDFSKLQAEVQKDWPEYFYPEKGQVLKVACSRPYPRGSQYAHRKGCRLLEFENFGLIAFIFNGKRFPLLCSYKFRIATEAEQFEYNLAEMQSMPRFERPAKELEIRLLEMA